MATLGAMGVLIDQVAAEFKANAELERQQALTLEQELTATHQAGIAHHYKSTRTRTDTIEIDAQDNASDTNTIKADDKAHEERKGHCGCFGRLFAKKK